MKVADTLLICGMAMLLGSRLTSDGYGWVAVTLSGEAIVISAGIRLLDYSKQKKLRHG